MFDSRAIGWKNTTIGKVAQCFAGGTPSRSKPEYYGPGIPWLKSGEVSVGRIERTEESITPLGLKESSARIAKAGTPVIAMYGANAGQAGILAIDAAMNQAVLAVLPDPKTMDREFCYQLLCSKTEQLLDRTQGSGQPNLSKALIEGLEIHLPPMDEQKRIAEVLRSVDRAADLGRSVSESLTRVFEVERDFFFASAAQIKLPTKLKTSGWRRTKFSEIFLERKEPGAPNLPVASVTIDQGLVLRSALDRRVESELPPAKHLLVKTGDLAYNTMRMWQGASGLASYDCIVSPAYVVITPSPEHLPRICRNYVTFSAYY